VTDFGMAQLMNENDHAASFRGSPLYMAPEVMLGNVYDAKVDLWSIGIILYGQ
jgi:serine/threonine-protein kinase ULK/ATG1